VSEGDPVYRYHDGTKHHFHRFARSLGYLDWASQPNPFRRFAGAPESPLVNQHSAPADILRYSLGLSAWKQFGASRWALRVNPSSGNLHPTEAYVVLPERQPSGPEEREPFPPSLAIHPRALRRGSPKRERREGVRRAAIYHYAADRHALEQRCALDPAAWRDAAGEDESTFLVALTSIQWREAWKYGERAFRYCQHDLGHAIAAVRIAAALHGLRARMLPDWSHADIAALTGIDREEDFVDAEREEAGCLLVVSRESQVISREPLIAAVRTGQWTGRANQLSEDHVRWTIIDEVAAATRDPGRDVVSAPSLPAPPAPPAYPAALVLQRRSAVALDGHSSIDAAAFFQMLARVMPSAAPPWDAIWWDARIHFLLFVHRVDGVAPGLYVLARNPSAIDRLREACRREFLWERSNDALPFFLLARGDCRSLARRLSCDQEIAADGFFSLGMLADFDASLQQFGPSFYRHLFWESGIVGQVLYLEAEAAGARGTGIGCFYDDPVHEALGLTGHTFQSLYHFTIGIPVEDTRLTTEPGYDWEA